MNEIASDNESNTYSLTEVIAMFFSRNKEVSAKTVVSRSQALREANSVLQEGLNTSFRDAEQHMRDELTQAGITGDEQDEFLRDLYQKMQLKMIEEFKERVKVAALSNYKTN